MGTDTTVRPTTTEVRTDRTIATPPSRNGLRTLLWIVAAVLVLGIALVTAVLVSGEPTETAQPQPGISAAEQQELQRLTNAVDVDRLTAAEQQELQRFTNAVDVDRLTAAEQQELQRFINAVDVN